MNSKSLMVEDRVISLADILEESELVARFDINRLVESGATRVNGSVADDPEELFRVPDTLQIEVGKRRSLTVFLIPKNVSPFR